MNLDLKVFADETWAEQAADLFVGRLRPGIRLCLPTGDTMGPFYREVAERSGLDSVHIFMLDEFGGLPEGDPGRCGEIIRRDLVDRLPDPPSIDLPTVDTPDPDAECLRYSRLVREGGIDLAIVGLGGNGHVGMNEPGSTADLPTRVVDLASSTRLHALGYGATTQPKWGITVGLAELLESREIWLLVTGSHKSAILFETVQGPITPEVPATLLRRHPRLTVLADESAAGHLRRD